MSGSNKEPIRKKSGEESLDEKLDRIYKLLVRNEQKLNTALKEITKIAGDSKFRDRPAETTIRENEVLDILSNAKQGLTISAIATRRNVSYSAAYKLVSSLEEKGYIKRKREPKGNKIIFELTE